MRTPTTGPRVLRRTLTRNRRRLGVGTLFICLHQLCESLVPIVIGLVIDRAIAPGLQSALVLWILALGAVFVTLTTVFRLGAGQLMLAIAEEAHRLRVELAEKIMHPGRVRTELRAGELLTVSTTDADNTSYLLDYVPRIAGAVTATAVSAVALLTIDLRLGLAVLLGTPVVVGLLQAGAPRLTRRVADQQELAGRAAAVATDLVSGARPLRGIGAQDAAARRYAAVSAHSLRAALRAAAAQHGHVAASAAGGALLAGGTAVLAGWFALTGHISVGELITVIGLAQFLMEPVGLLAVVPSWVGEARASADRVASVLAAEVHVTSGSATVDTVDTAPELAVAGLRYGSLAGVDLVVRPGELVGVVPHRTADGAALVTVLSGRIPPADYHGTVRVGGRSLATLDLAAVRSALLVEPHHTDLFTGTIRTNLVLDEGPDPADPTDPTKVAAALRAAAADQVVASHPEGLDRDVTERGASLSGGQRQRIALARALLVQPPILVLHDPTTAVDAVTEHAIAQGVRALRHREDSPLWTTVVVTTSPALLAVTDRVVVLDEGHVVAEGTHAGLSATDDHYRRAVLR